MPTTPVTFGVLELLLLDQLALAVLDHRHGLDRDLDLVDEVLHVERGLALLDVGPHPVLVAGVGVQDVPVTQLGGEHRAHLGDRVELLVGVHEGLVDGRVDLGRHRGAVGLVGLGHERVGRRVGGDRLAGCVAGDLVLRCLEVGSDRGVLVDDLEGGLLGGRRLDDDAVVGVVALRLGPGHVALGGQAGGVVEARRRRRDGRLVGRLTARLCAGVVGLVGGQVVLGHACFLL
jgi:hypothetical protein